MKIERADLQGARRVMLSAYASASVKRVPMWQPTPVCCSLSNKPSVHTASKMDDSEYENTGAREPKLP